MLLTDYFEAVFVKNNSRQGMNFLRKFNHCPRATDLVAELAVAIERGMTAAELAAVIHPHPTFSEMIHGAAEALL